MIDQSVAFSLLCRWEDKRTRLRVDAVLGVLSFSFECAIGRVDEPLVGLLLSDLGFIEFKFDETWGFDFVAPDAARIETSERLGASPLASKRYEFGETLCAVRRTGAFIFFLEIVRELDKELPQP